MIRLDSLPVGRASLTLPWAILRMTMEKAGASMCRLGFFIRTNPLITAQVRLRPRRPGTPT